MQGDLYRGDIGRSAPSINGHRAARSDRQAAGRRHRRQRARAVAALARVRLGPAAARSTSTARTATIPAFDDDLDTVDVELQHRYLRVARHEIVWGVNYRYTRQQQ